MKKYKVLIVDDSAVIRQFLTGIINSDPEFQVVDFAPDPYIAREKILLHKPDLMTLDIEMPRMDGVTFLSKIMEHFPIRTMIFSSLTTKHSELALQALELGAIDVMTKPAIDVNKGLGQIAKEILTRLKVVAKAPLQTEKKVFKAFANKKNLSLSKTTHQILAIASSTGGTEALKVVLPNLPADIPGTVIVQHMPPVFTKTFAENLNKLCPFEVKEAEENDAVLPGRVLIAPGNFHMEIARRGGGYYVNLNQNPPEHNVRPAADVLMRSVAKNVGANAIGLVLTGMGKDGADGLLAMKNAGSLNIAQDEKSCVVFGMPKAALEKEAIHKTLNLNLIANELKEQFNKRKVA